MLALCLALGQLGPVVDLPQAVIDASPFAHSPQLPGGTLDAAPLVLGALAAALTAAGLAGPEAPRPELKPKPCQGCVKVALACRDHARFPCRHA